MAVKISASPDINSVLHKDQSSTPTTPASGYVQVFTKTDNDLYTIGSDGVVRPIKPVAQMALFSQAFS